jgi:hypothetical protein
MLTGILIFSGLIAMLLAIVFVPLSLLVRFEYGWGGPFWSLHIPVNIVFLAWAISDIGWGYIYPHGPSPPLLFPPLLLALALFYWFAVPRLACPLSKRSLFVSRTIGGVYAATIVIGIALAAVGL